MYNLKDKVVIVTGASRGIGYGIADAFAAQGAKVVCAATRQEKCDEIAKELSEKHGTTCIGKQTDVSNFESAQELIKTTVDTFGEVSVLVNNAGITRDNLILRMTESDWTDVITTNLNSVFNCTKAAIRPMLKKKYGRIVHISSVVGIMGNPGQANYAASKAGMIGFSKSIAKEFGAKGITSNVVAPGFIGTDMIESLPKDYLDKIIQSVPLRRLGETEDIANLALFLGSDLASYITGEVITVDGGIQM